jgi:hypothetical protein
VAVATRYAGILEQLGATTSSKDASFENDTLRYKRLEDSLHKLSIQVTAYIDSLRKNCEDAREVTTSIDFYSSFDVKSHIRERTIDAVRFIDALQALLRVQNGIKTAVLASIEKSIVLRILKPLGNLLNALPRVKRLMDQRSLHLTGNSLFSNRSIIPAQPHVAACCRL